MPGRASRRLDARPLTDALGTATVFDARRYRRLLYRTIIA